MITKVAVVEPPFIEPGMPYPDIIQVSAALKSLGVDAFPLDLNVKLYRSILQDDSTTYSPGLFVASAQKAFFAETKEPGSTIKVGRIGLDIMSLFSKLQSHALPFFTGKIFRPSHSDYVMYSELLNAFLDCRVKEIDPRFELWLDHFSSSVDIHYPESVFNGIWGEKSNILKLYDKYFGRIGVLEPTGDIMILIRKEEQLFPGLALSYWLTSRGHSKVTLAGDFLTCVLTMKFPKEMFKLCDCVILHPLEYCLRSWVGEKTHPNIIKSFRLLTRINSCSAMTFETLPFQFEAVNTDEYLSPISVSGVQITSRCYWSRCKFCNLAKAIVHPFRQCNHSVFNTKLETLEKYSHLKHLQFLDYALPFSLFNDRLKTRKLSSLRWAAQVRFERLCLDTTFFENLYKKGCRALSWGFESGSSRLLEDMGKGGVTQIDERKEILKRAADAGISNHLFLISGYPGEEHHDFMDTIEFLTENIEVFHSVETYAFQPIYGTKAYSDLLKKGMITKKGEWNLKASYLDEELQNAAESKNRFIDENFLRLGAVNRCNDLLEGHMAFQYLLRRNEQ